MKAKINKVFDTHLHVDHISAAKKLAEKTNAQLYLSHYEEGYNAELRYNSTKLNDPACTFDVRNKINDSSVQNLFYLCPLILMFYTK